MNNRNYNDPEYANFRRRVRKRDGYKCAWPGCGLKKVQVHHIMPWAKYPHLRYTDSNGICLCKTHHKQVTKQEEMWCMLLNTIVQQIMSKKKVNKKRGK